MNRAFIMRGVPGSGKTTLARMLAADIGIIHSTDDYFYENGAYRPDWTKLKEYHHRNLEAFCESMRRGVPVVICDNVNQRYEHFEPYADAAMDHGYLVACVVLPHPNPEVAAKRNVHNVPVNTIERMIDEWEY